MPEVAIQGLAEHNVREYTNLRNLLPGIYDGIGRAHPLAGAVRGAAARVGARCSRQHAVARPATSLCRAAPGGSP